MTFHHAITPFLLSLFIIGLSPILSNIKKTKFFYNNSTLIYVFSVTVIITCFVFFQNFLNDRNNYFSYITNICQMVDNFMTTFIFLLYNAFIYGTIIKRKDHLKLLNEFNYINNLINKVPNKCYNSKKLFKTCFYALTIVCVFLLNSFGCYVWSTTKSFDSLMYGFSYTIQMGTFYIMFAYIRYLAKFMQQFLINTKKAYKLIFSKNCCYINYKNLGNLQNIFNEILILNENFGNVFGCLLLINSIYDFLLTTSMGFTVVMVYRLIDVDHLFVMKIFYLLYYLIPIQLKNIFIVGALENISKEVNNNNYIC